MQPTAVSQTAPLKGLPGGVKRAAYVEAVADAGGQVPTAAVVEAAVARVAPVALGSKRATKAETDADPVAAGVRAGAIPEGAQVEVIDSNPSAAAPGPETAGAEPPTEPPPEPTDDEYLAAMPVRAKLAPHCRERFDAEALAFRRLTPARQHFGRQAKPITNEAKRSCPGHVGPYLGRIRRLITTEAPERWPACFECHGTGRMLTGDCPKCHGAGYRLD